MGAIAGLPLAQAVAEGYAFIEHKALTAPAALFFWHAFQVFQDSTLEVIDLAKTAVQEKRAGLFAANAAGAKHRNPAMLCRVEFSRDKFLELPKAPDARIDCALKGSHRNLEGVPGVDDERIRLRDQRVPVCGIDINADLP